MCSITIYYKILDIKENMVLMAFHLLYSVKLKNKQTKTHQIQQTDFELDFSSTVL